MAEWPAMDEHICSKISNLHGFRCSKWTHTCTLLIKVAYFPECGTFVICVNFVYSFLSLKKREPKPKQHKVRCLTRLQFYKLHHFAWKPFRNICSLMSISSPDLFCCWFRSNLCLHSFLYKQEISNFWNCKIIAEFLFPEIYYHPNAC